MRGVSAAAACLSTRRAARRAGQAVERLRGAVQLVGGWLLPVDPGFVISAGGAFWLPALIVAPALSVGRGLPVALPERVRRSCGCACR